MRSEPAVYSHCHQHIFCLSYFSYPRHVTAFRSPQPFSGWSQSPRRWQMCHLSLPSINRSKLPVQAAKQPIPLWRSPMAEASEGDHHQHTTGPGQAVCNRPADTARVESLNNLLHCKVTSCGKDSCISLLNNLSIISSELHPWAKKQQWAAKLFLQLSSSS